MSPRDVGSLMASDTTKQRLIDSGLFIEQGPHLVYDDEDILPGGELGVVTRTLMRFNTAGELTSIVTHIAERIR